MNDDPVDIIARALLYEGYLLYPYRPSAVKNQQRFNFGVLYPQAYAERADGSSGSDGWQLQTQCPVRGDAETQIEVSVRFLQLFERQPQTHSTDVWHEAVERSFSVGWFNIGETGHYVEQTRIGFFAVDPVDPERRTPSVAGVEVEDSVRVDVRVEVAEIRAGVYTLTVRVSNAASMDVSGVSRSDALSRSLVSAHVVLRVAGGELISLLDPPDTFRDIAVRCANVGVWPVLVGGEGSHDCMLASPIILYDYPHVAPESAGDLFDSTEIDEILALRILTMTDEEKREARGADDRARQILERTEALPPEHWAKLHGALRGLRPTTRDTP